MGLRFSLPISLPNGLRVTLFMLTQGTAGQLQLCAYSMKEGWKSQRKSLVTSGLVMAADVSLKESYRLSHFVPWPTSLIWISEYGFQCRFEIEKLWQVTT